MMAYLQWLNWRSGTPILIALCVLAVALTSPRLSPDDGFHFDWLSVFGVWVGIFASLISGGNGIRSHWLPRNHAWTYYVLSLPVSRRRFVLTHVATTTMMAIVANIVVLGLAITVLRLKGIEIEHDFVVGSLLLSQANAIAVVLGLAALATLLKGFWFFATWIVAATGYSVAADAVARALAEQVVPWQGLVLAAPVAIVGLILTLRYVSKQDY